MANVNALSAETPDQKAIRTVLMEYVEAWNHHDMNALAVLIDDDANWINIVGMHWRGKSAVVKGHEVYHRTMFLKTEITITEFVVGALTSDVGVSVVTLKVGDFTPPDGQPRIGTHDRLSFILVKREGRWRIAHGHNTVIDANAQRFDPVNSGWNDESQK